MNNLYIGLIIAVIVVVVIVVLVKKKGCCGRAKEESVIAEKPGDGFKMSSPEPEIADDVEESEEPKEEYSESREEEIQE